MISKIINAGEVVIPLGFLGAVFLMERSDKLAKHKEEMSYLDAMKRHIAGDHSAKVVRVPIWNNPKNKEMNFANGMLILTAGAVTIGGIIRRSPGIHGFGYGLTMGLSTTFFFAREIYNRE